MGLPLLVKMSANYSGGNGSMGDNSSHPGISGFVYAGEAVIEPTVLAVGILTNAMSAIVLCGSRIPRNLRICIVSLTLSDLLATVFGFTQVVIEVVYFGGDIEFGHWHDEAVASFTLYFIFIMFMCVSASIVILLAVIRCCLVLKPVASRQFLTPRKTKMLCFFTSLTVVILFIPTMLNVLWQSCYKELHHPACVRVQDSMEGIGSFANGYLYMLTVLFGPILVIIYITCFIAIRVMLGRSKEIMSTLTERTASTSSSGTMGGPQRRLSITSRVTRTLLAILVLDTICTLPTVIQSIGLVVAPEGTVFAKDNKWQNIFDVIAEIFLCMRPTYNFWLYAFTHKEFQHRGREILWIMQRRCRCFFLGLIKVPSNDDVSSRTHTTAIHDGGGCSVPQSPTGRYHLKIAPLTYQEQRQVQKSLANEAQPLNGHGDRYRRTNSSNSHV